MDKLQFFVVSHQLLNLFRMMFNQVLNSLDMVNILTNLHRLVIEPCKGKATQDRRVHLILESNIDVGVNTIIQRKRMFDVKEYLHHTIIVMRLKVVIHDVVLNSNTMSYQ